MVSGADRPPPGARSRIQRTDLRVTPRPRPDAPAAAVGPATARLSLRHARRLAALGVPGDGRLPPHRTPGAARGRAAAPVRGWPHAYDRGRALYYARSR